mmetsp:Transcript_50475/g.114618  ORF Transcript_50475/g.114618 Transcript_50475/m.114618 type:complete len:275 (-) Transcript_50475:68-892(-)
MLLRAHHVGDSHGGVVDRDAEVVDGHSAGPKEDEVAHHGLGVPPHLAADQVVDLHAGPGGHLETNHVRVAVFDLFFDGFRVRVTPGTRVHEVLALRLGLGPLGLEFLLRGEARVGVAFSDELVGALLVNVAPLRLPVRAEVPPDVGSLVPVQPKPPKVGDHGLLGLARRPRQIRVLDAEDELATLLPRLEPVEESRAGTAHVESSRRGRGKAHAHIRAGRAHVHDGPAPRLHLLAEGPRRRGRPEQGRSKSARPYGSLKSHSSRRSDGEQKSYP